MKQQSILITFVFSLTIILSLWINSADATISVATSPFEDIWENVNNNSDSYLDVESWKNDFKEWLNTLGVSEENSVFMELSGVSSFDEANDLYIKYANLLREEARNLYWGYTINAWTAQEEQFLKNYKIYSETDIIRINSVKHTIVSSGTWFYFSCETSKCPGSLNVLQIYYGMDEGEYSSWYSQVDNSNGWSGTDPPDFAEAAVINGVSIQQYPSIYKNLNFKVEFEPDQIFGIDADNTYHVMGRHNAYITSNVSKFKIFLPPGVEHTNIKFKFHTTQCLPPEAPIPVFGETTLTINKINHSPANPEENNTVSFSASITGNPSSYSWEIDGTPVSAQSGFSHKFTEEGSYSVRLTVTDSSGNEDIKSITVHVQAEPTVTLAISAITPSTSSPFENDTVSFSASFTGSPSTYSWTIDGVPVSNQATFSHTFAEEGDYAVSLTVTDASGNEATKAYTLHVKNGTEPITASIKASIPNIDNPLEIAFIALDASGGEPLSTGYGYEWDFGGISTDQTYIAEPRVLFPAGGAYEIKLAVNGEAQPSKTITLNQQNPINVYFYDENNETDLSFRIPELHLFNSPASEEWVPFRDIVFYLKPGTELLWTLTPGE